MSLSLLKDVIEHDESVKCLSLFCFFAISYDTYFPIKKLKFYNRSVKQKRPAEDTHACKKGGNKKGEEKRPTALRTSLFPFH